LVAFTTASRHRSPNNSSWLRHRNLHPPCSRPTLWLHTAAPLNCRVLQARRGVFNGWLHGCMVRCDPCFFRRRRTLGEKVYPLHRGGLQTRVLYRRSAGAKNCALTHPLNGPFCTCTQSACRLVTLSRVPFSAIAKTLPFGEGVDRMFTLGGCTKRISSLRARPVLSDPVGNVAEATF
jgi:hypothetical protein